MSGSAKDEVLRYDQRVVAAKKIEKIAGSHHPEISEITGRIRHLAKDPLTVVVLGEFSAGKSSFLNRLLATDALPVAVLPKTATVTRLVHLDQGRKGPDGEGLVEIEREVAEGTETQEISHQAFAELQRAAKVHDISVAQDLSSIREVRVFLDEPLLTRLQLVDTPGFNHDQAMDDRTLGILDTADIVFWVTDAVQPAKQTEFQKLRLLKERGKRIWLIVTKADINVSNSTDWEESRQSLESYFIDIGFLDFFESRTLELISCRETDEFWNLKFEQTKARLGAEIFNDDVRWSSRLLNDEWRRLQELLKGEAGRYQELAKQSDVMNELIRSELSPDCRTTDLNAALSFQRYEVHQRMLVHRQIARQAVQKGMESVTAFVMEFTREPLVQAFNDLSEAYGDFLRECQVQHLSRCIKSLKAIYQALPQAQESLRGDAFALLNYQTLLRARVLEPVSNSGRHRLPALERTVELLDRLTVHLETLDIPFYYLSTDQHGVQQNNVPGEMLYLSEYSQLELKTALERDFCADLERIVHDPACLGLLDQLKDLCQGAERLTVALQIWSNHATDPELE